MKNYFSKYKIKDYGQVQRYQKEESFFLAFFNFVAVVLMFLLIMAILIMIAPKI